MGRIRPARRGDAPALVKLHERTLLDGPPSPDAARFVRAFYESVLFDNPWAAADLPSLLYEGADGAVAAFVGVLPRPMELRGRRVRAALVTRVMADPDHPDGAIGVAALFRHALRGPQDLSLADVVNGPGRRLWEASKGLLVAASSLWWTAAPPAPSAAPESRPAEPGELLELVARGARARLLRPVYDEASLDWLLRHMAGARHRGELHVRVLPGAGWYLAYTNPDGTGSLPQIAAFRGQEGRVVADALAFAGRRAGGRVDLELADALTAAGAALRLGPLTYAHSKDQDVLLALTSGQAFLSRLEGEY
ncbi:hypothetical protein BJF78_19555 [Pseudonocardia sp. CNS-139]|nr:hypothetical protein BJF78_19555 [Pseudonocardia sp. CNS-139]